LEDTEGDRECLEKSNLKLSFLCKVSANPRRAEQKDFWKGVEKELKMKRIQIPMSLVLAKEECTQALLDFLSLQMLAELAEWWRRWRT